MALNNLTAMFPWKANNVHSDKEIDINSFDQYRYNGWKMIFRLQKVFSVVMSNW